MAAPNKQSSFHVLVIGAGSVGLLIAQRLKTLGIKCTVFEREHYLNERSRDWSYGVYWAQDWLRECLPDSIHNKLTVAQVDSSRFPSPDDTIRLLNGETAQEFVTLPVPNLYRLRRSKFRVLLAEGVDVQYGRRLKGISNNTRDGDATVTATFEDGSNAIGNILVGADGSNSIVRKYLHDPETAALQPLPLIGLHAEFKFPTEIAKKMAAELHGQVAIVTYHPAACCGFFPIHIVPDKERPETWTWSPTQTIRREAGLEGLTTPAEIRSIWNEYAEKFAEPFRSALLSLPEDAALWCERLAQWPTLQWEKNGGVVTLAGDAAHPMTYHRGQGLNNAVHDACTLSRALDDHLTDGKPLEDVIAAYEAELVERGHEAVISSGQNSMMIHDWDQLMDAPVFKQGIASGNKGGGKG